MRSCGVCARCVAIGLLLAAVQARAQLSLPSAVSLALQNSPRVKMAEDDRNRAAAAAAETTDVYIPSAVLGGAVGRSYGITLNVPTIFTATTQSLVYSAAQRDYVHAAAQSLQAATLALIDVRQQIEEDVATTYIVINDLQLRRTALSEEGELSAKMLTVTAQRAEAGLETSLEVKRTKRAGLELRIALRQLDEEIASQQEHLGLLIGQPAMGLTTVPESIPGLTEDAPADPLPDAPQSSPGLLSLERNARAKAEQAHAETHYAFRPQFYLFGQYGRVSPIQDVSQYYNLNGKYNIFAFAVQINLPLFDKAHSARARETEADAMHAQHEAQMVRAQQSEAYHRQQNALIDLQNHLELTKLDREIAADQLTAMLIDVQAPSIASAGRQMNPRDELNARMDERRRYLDYLDAKLQLERAQISMMRQTGDLDEWVKGTGK